MAKRKKPAKLVDFKKRTEPDNALIQIEEYDPDLEIDDEENLKELMALQPRIYVKLAFAIQEPIGLLRDFYVPLKLGFRVFLNKLN